MPRLSLLHLGSDHGEQVCSNDDHTHCNLAHNGCQCGSQVAQHRYTQDLLSDYIRIWNRCQIVSGISIALRDNFSVSDLVLDHPVRHRHFTAIMVVEYDNVSRLQSRRLSLCRIDHAPDWDSRFHTAADDYILLNSCKAPILGRYCISLGYPVLYFTSFFPLTKRVGTSTIFFLFNSSQASLA